MPRQNMWLVRSVWTKTWTISWLSFCVERVEEHRLTLAEDRGFHVEPAVVGHLALVEGPGLLGHADGVEQADARREVGGIVRRRGDRDDRGRARVDLDR